MEPERQHMHPFSLTCDECVDAFRAVGTARVHAVEWYRQALKYGRPDDGPAFRLPQELGWPLPDIAETAEQVRELLRREGQ